MLNIGSGSAYESRTRVSALRGRCPGPLDECAADASLSVRDANPGSAPQSSASRPSNPNDDLTVGIQTTVSLQGVSVPDAEPVGPARRAYLQRLASLNRRADALLGHLDAGEYDDLLPPRMIADRERHDCPPELRHLLTCEECGEVSREWYDTGAGIEAFCDCNPRPGRSYHGWYATEDGEEGPGTGRWVAAFVLDPETNPPSGDWQPDLPFGVEVEG